MLFSNGHVFGMWAISEWGQVAHASAPPHPVGSLNIFLRSSGVSAFWWTIVLRGACHIPNDRVDKSPDISGATLNQAMHRTMSSPIEEKTVIELAENVESGKPVADHVLVNADGEVQQLPVPSKDPNDPLNYTKWEKIGIIVSCCWFCESI
jgi:hypothetical protein